MNFDPPENSSASPLDDDIDTSLEHQFRASQPPPEHLADLLGAFESKQDGPTKSRSATKENPTRSVSRWQVVASLTVAACLLIAVSIWGPKSWRSLNTTPVFESVPLASLYNDAVQRGFTPYYDCSDDSRFLATMRHRHRVDLRINSETDPDATEAVRMLGVSYSGGLSRDSTVILFIVGQKPVMVFVDNDEVTVSPTVLDNSPNPELNTFETRRDGLVFVEISPFDMPLATPTIEEVTE